MISIRFLWLTLKLSLKSLFLHKLRSALTVLGILIGVTAVIWLVAMGEGVSYEAQQQIKNLGATNIIVRSVKPTTMRGDRGSSFFIEYGLLRDDFDRIRNSIPAIEKAVPVREIMQGCWYKDRTQDCRVVGCTPDYAGMNQLKVERGRFITDRDLFERKNVCVIGHETAKRLFPFEDPLGASVQISQDFYVVVGITAERAESAGIGGSLAAQNYNLDIYIPLETLRWRIGDQIMTSRSGSREAEVVQLSQITLKLKRIEDVDSTAQLVGELLRRHHENQDYSITVPKELLRQAETMKMLFTALLVLISGISLLVGGIGIMNIMLATVTERTREIGIRRALGAKRAHIMWQFLLETLVLTLVGGLLGVLLGFLCGPVIDLFQEAIRSYDPRLWEQLPDSVRNLEPRIAWWSIGVSLLIAVLVGVFFGLYPARRAAFMDPIDALRHE
jgi:putative ABC transport system permease protein